MLLVEGQFNYFLSDFINELRFSYAQVITRIQRITEAFKIESAKVYYLNWLSDWFDDMSSTIANVSTEINTYNESDLQYHLNFISKFIPKLRSLIAHLEEANFHGDESLERKVIQTLDAFYDLEGDLRMKMKVFKSDSKTSSEREFIHALTDKSKAAIGSVLSK